VWDTAPMSCPSWHRRSHPLHTPVAFAWRLSIYQNTIQDIRVITTRGNVIGVNWGKKKHLNKILYIKNSHHFQYYICHEHGKINCNPSTTQEVTKIPVTTMVTPNYITPAVVDICSPWSYILVIKYHSTPTSYSGGLGFKSQPRDQLTWVRFIFIFLSFSKQMLGLVPQITPQLLPSTHLMLYCLNY
jgi:hypothetical protein